MQIFNESIMEGNMTIAIMTNIIINDIVYKNNKSFTIYWYSSLMAILNITTRITQMYIRRVRSQKNYKFSKDSKPFQSLTEEEKLVLFYPKYSVANTIEFVDPARAAKVYNYRHKSQLSLKPTSVVWIWVITLLNLVSFYYTYSIASLFYVLPNMGFTPMSQLPKADYLLVYPYGYLSGIVFVNLVKFIYLMIHSRGYILKSVLNTPNILRKFINIIILFLGLQFDYSFLPREEPPFLFLLEPEVRVNENWVDNQESQHVFVTIRLLYQLICLHLIPLLVFNFWEWNQVLKSRFYDLFFYKMCLYTTYLNIAIHLTHYFLRFKISRI